MSVPFERLRLAPPSVVCICAACGESGREYYLVMITHKQGAKSGELWCPRCYEALTGRKFTQGHLGDSNCRKKGCASLPLQKPGGSASSCGSLSGTPCTGTIFESFPTLWEFLTLSKWPDASLRKVGTIILFTEGDKWKCCVKDPSGGRVAFVTGKDLDSLLLAVDAGLDQDDLDWRPDRPQGGQGKKFS